MAISFRGASGHAPPPRSPIARAAFLLVFLAIRAKFKAGDLNLEGPAAALALARKVIGGGVLWLTVPRRGWKTLSREHIDVGSDHPAEFVRMKHIPTGRVVTFLVINCMSVSTGKLHAAQIMRVGIELGADVIFASECRDFWAAHVDKGHLYHWNQPGKLGSPESGALIGSLRSTTKMSESRHFVGSRSTREGGGIDTRSIARSRITMLDTERTKH